MKQKKSQSAFEFIFIISVMVFLVFLLLSIVNARITDFESTRKVKTAEEIGDIIFDQQTFIASLSDGISTEFVIPQYYNGREYEMSIIDNRELVIVYKGYEYVIYLKPDLVTPTGPVYPVPWGRNTIVKQGGVISLNP